jgi:hypothetical protein
MTIITKRLPRRASSQWRKSSSLRGKYDRSNPMIETKNKQIATSCLLAMTIKTNRLPRRKNVSQWRKSSSLRGKYDRSNLMIETKKQKDCHVVPPRNDASPRHHEGSMTEVIPWLKLKTKRLPRRKNVSQWRKSSSLRGKYDWSNLMIETKNKQIATSCLLAMTIITNRLPRRKNVSQWRKSSSLRGKYDRSNLRNWN